MRVAPQLRLSKPPHYHSGNLPVLLLPACRAAAYGFLSSTVTGVRREEGEGVEPSRFTVAQFSRLLPDRPGPPSMRHAVKHAGHIPLVTLTLHLRAVVHKAPSLCQLELGTLPALARTLQTYRTRPPWRHRHLPSLPCVERRGYRTPITGQLDRPAPRPSAPAPPLGVAARSRTGTSAVTMRRPAIGPQSP